MNSGELLGRVVVVQVRGGDQIRTLQGLHVRFNSRYTRSSEPNESTVQVWNPAPETIAILQRADAEVRVIAGYAQNVPSIVALGNPNVRGVTYDRTPPNPSITISLKDGGNALSHARLDQTFKGPTTLTQVISACSQALGLPTNVIDLPTGADVIAWPNGVTFHGPVRDVLNRVAEASARQWWVADGAVHIVQQGGEVPGLRPVFSASSGNLIGSPRRRDDGGIEITGLLDPSLRPGSAFRVESADVNGDFVADEVTFEGDSESGPFYVHIVVDGTAPRERANATDAPVANRGAAIPSDQDQLRESLRALAASLHVHMPARVVSYDAATQTITAQPSIRAKRVSADGKTIESYDLPQIHKVPVVWPSASGGSFTIHLAAGDPVQLVFSDRSLDEWRAQTGGGPFDARDPRLHDLSDCVAWPGGLQPGAALASTRYATGAAVLAGDDVRLGASTATDRAVLGSALEGDLSTLVQALFAFLTTASTATTAPQIAAAAITALVSITPAFVARFTTSVASGAPHLSTLVKVK